MHFKFNAFHLISGNALCAQLRARVDAGVNHNAAGKGLVGVERNFKTLAEFVGHFVPSVFGGNGLNHAAGCLQRFGAGGKALAGQQCRHQTGTCRTAGVEGFGHSAKLLAHAYGL